MANPFITLSTFALITEEEAKIYLKSKEQATPEDELLKWLINAASENVEQFLNQEIVTRGTITEDHNIRRGNIFRIWLRQRPVIEPPTFELYEDANRQFGAGTLIPAAEYVLDKERGVVERTGTGGTFPIPFTAGLGIVRAVYAAGAANTAAVAQKYKFWCAETVASYFLHVANSDVNRRSISDEAGNQTFIEFDWLPKHVQKGLGKLRKKRPGSVTGRRVSVA